MIIGLISMPVTSRHAEEALRQDVPTAAHADNGTCLQVRNGIGEVGHVMAQEPQDSRGFHRSGIGRCRHRRRSSAHRCSIVEAGKRGEGAAHRRRACFALTDGDAGKRIPAIIGKIGRRFQVILDDRRSNAIGRERVGNRKEQAPCEDASAVAK